MAPQLPREGRAVKAFVVEFTGRIAKWCVVLGGAMVLLEVANMLI